MIANLSLPANVFWQIVRRDLTIHFRNYTSALINMVIQFASNIITFGYLFSYSGVESDFAPFYFMGCLATFGFFVTVGYSYELIGDIEADRSINYHLTMPLPSWLVFCAIGVSWSLRTATNIAPMFLLGKLMLWNQLDLSAISYGPFIFQFITICLFYGFFAVWTATVFKRMSDAANIWIRLVTPMFLFGAFIFTWKSVYATRPIIALLILLDPITFANEGLRATVLNQTDYIPFWVCCSVLWGCIFLFGGWGIKRMRNWLDSI